MLSMLALKAYLKEKRRVSLVQLANVFSEQGSVIEGMLSHFIRKGQLRPCEMGKGACQGCALKCNKTAMVTMFEWMNN